MISKLTITNYESHHDTVLKFNPGITVITGATDVGKSSIRRAFEWVTCNRPSGDKFISWGESKAVVSLDGVKKSRSTKAHIYEVGEHKYKAFRTEVPAPVYETLKVSALNIQKQHNPYFLLNDSPGQVARTLNEVSNLTLIDASLQEGKSRLRKVKGKITLLHEQKEKKDQEIKETEWAVEAAKELKELRGQLKQVEVQKEAITALSNVINEVKIAQDSFLKYPLISKDLVILDSTIISLDATLRDQVKAAVDTAVASTITGLDDVSMDMEKVSEVLSRLNKKAIDQLTGQLEKQAQHRQEIKGYEDIPKDILSLIKIVEETDSAKRLKTTVEDAVNADAKLKKITVECVSSEEAFYGKLKELEICPLCGGDTHEIN